MKDEKMKEHDREEQWWGKVIKGKVIGMKQKTEKGKGKRRKLWKKISGNRRENKENNWERARKED